MVADNHGAFASPSANANTFAVQSVAEGMLWQMYNHLNWWTVMAAVLLLMVLYDQVSYQLQKARIVGPLFKIPFIGPFLEAVYPDMEVYKAKWRSGDLSCVSVFHKFVVLASTRDLARKVFNSPAFVKPCVVDIAVKLLRPANFVFLDGKQHADYRKALNGLFTRQALEIYLPGQEEVYHKYFDHFVNLGTASKGASIPYMPIFREFMCAVSCRTFVGYYMSEAMVKRIAGDYYYITAALDLVNFPIIIPFTRPWYGKKAADVVVIEFAKCAAKSKARMAAGGATTCILDCWMKQCLESETYRQKVAAGAAVDPSEKPAQLLREFSDTEIALTLLAFLFASQDATTSAATWMFQFMADNPDMLDRLRAENVAACKGNRDAPLSISVIESLTYTRAVVKETLRYRPPVIMVPYMAKKDYPITPTFTARKGSMIVSCVYPALHDPEAYPEPDTFDPDRWITGTAEQQTKNWLVFGTGPHYCLGQTYAILNLMALIGKASMHLNWRHDITSTSEDIKVFAGIFPKDDCHLAFSRREHASA